jgi:hypothetical protein
MCSNLALVLTAAQRSAANCSLRSLAASFDEPPQDNAGVMPQKPENGFECIPVISRFLGIATAIL